MSNVVGTIPRATPTVREVRDALLTLAGLKILWEDQDPRNPPLMRREEAEAVTTVIDWVTRDVDYSDPRTLMEGPL